MIHVIPVGNGEPIHHASEGCWCHPLKEEIITHHAKDCRERFERQGITHPDKTWVLISAPE